MIFSYSWPFKPFIKYSCFCCSLHDTSVLENFIYVASRIGCACAVKKVEQVVDIGKAIAFDLQDLCPLQLKSFNK